MYIYTIYIQYVYYAVKLILFVYFFSVERAEFGIPLLHLGKLLKEDLTHGDTAAVSAHKQY